MSESSTTRFPPLMQNSHDDGSKAALYTFLTFFLMWETLYHIARFSLKIALEKHPLLLAESDKQNGNGHKDGVNGNNSPTDDAKLTLLKRGPSYAVSLLHSIIVTGRGVMHLYNLWNASNYDKLFIPGKEVVDSYRWAHLQVATTNTMFLSYLIYDLFHSDTISKIGWC